MYIFEQGEVIFTLDEDKRQFITVINTKAPISFCKANEPGEELV
jgi:hypothetical protein